MFYTYKLDFEQERNDREEVMGRFVGEREAFIADIVRLEEEAKHLEHDDTVAQLQQLKTLSLAQKKVRNQITSYKTFSGGFRGHMELFRTCYVCMLYVVELGCQGYCCSMQQWHMKLITEEKQLSIVSQLGNVSFLY